MKTRKRPDVEYASKGGCTVSCYSPGVILQVSVSIFLQYEMEVLQFYGT